MYGLPSWHESDLGNDVYSYPVSEDIIYSQVIVLVIWCLEDLIVLATESIGWLTDIWLFQPHKLNCLNEIGWPAWRIALPFAVLSCCLVLETVVQQVRLRAGWSLELGWRLIGIQSLETMILNNKLNMEWSSGWMGCKGGWEIVVIGCEAAGCVIY